MFSRHLLRVVLSLILLSLVTPVASAADVERLGLYAVDVERGKVEQIAEEPLPGLTYCGSPSWSPDGRRVLFDATPGRNWSKTRVLVRDSDRRGKIRFTDLGPGNCPTWSPDGKQIAFLLNPGAVPDAEPGIWTMNADGTGRRRLGGYGIPKWSPDGKRLLVVSFSSPCRMSLMDAGTGQETPVMTDGGFPVYSVPGWAGDDGETIVAVVRSAGNVSIALVDLADPERARIGQTLWTRGEGTNVEPLYPVFSPATGRCVFVGRDRTGSALFMFDTKRPTAPEPLEPDQYDSKLASLAFSPDGRRVLFCSDRAPMAPAAGSADQK